MGVPMRVRYTWTGMCHLAVLSGTLIRSERESSLYVCVQACVCLLLSLQELQAHAQETTASQAIEAALSLSWGYLCLSLCRIPFRSLFRGRVLSPVWVVTDSCWSHGAFVAINPWMCLSWFLIHRKKTCFCFLMVYEYKELIWIIH